VGVALSDPLGVTAQPLVVVRREEAIQRIVELCVEKEVQLIVVGLPGRLRGGEGEAAAAARALAAELATATGLPVEMIDEKFTTTSAERIMIESGTRRRRRRQAIDKVAAAIILQSFLDRSR
jgi:putative Holliday junction resolvase